YVFKLARITAGNKAEKFLVVSSMGADADSSIFYSRLKGEMEEAVSALNFKAVHIFRPPFIIGEKDRPERRPMERILEIVLKPLPFLFVGPLQKYRPIQAQTIARAMVKTAQTNLVGVHVWESNQIEKLAAIEVHK
ncbi:MAG TPA: oxidoreductase, partial [bacterium]